MEIYVFARILHFLSVVVWIGGVSMVTTVVIPLLRKEHPEKAIELFSKFEKKFSLQARITIILVGLTGFYMLDYLHAWNRYLEIRFWWIHAMTLVWLIFTIMLFILEPIVFHRVFSQKTKENPVSFFNKIQVFHWVLLILSWITIIGAVAGSHGWFFF